MTKDDAGVGSTVIVGDAVVYLTEDGVYRVPLGDMNPDHAQLLSPDARTFLVLDNQLGLFEGPDANHLDTLAVYTLDGTRGASLSLPKTESSPSWTYDAARKSLLGVKSQFPVKSLVRVELASGQSDELMVTPTFSHESYDPLVVNSAGIIMGDSDADKLHRIDAVTGSATEIPTGLPSFLVVGVDASNAYLKVSASQPNPGIYRQPLQGGGMATRISELDGREAFVYVTPAGTFGDNRNAFGQGADFSLFRIGPDAPAAPTKVVDNDCDGAASINSYQGSLYISVSPYDATWLLRMPLP